MTRLQRQADSNKRRGDSMRKSSKRCFARLALLPIALTGPLAHAQSSVTLYGVVDESFRFITNANKAGDSNFSLGNGGMTQRRWALKGVEDLGGGWQTFFKLEN